MFYKTIFNINFQHAYFLDEGQTKFSPTGTETGMTDEEKETALKNYEINAFIKIVPTKSTNKLISNHRMMSVNHNQGFRLLISAQEVLILGNKKYNPLVQLDDDDVFTFAIYVTDSKFYNYTKLDDIVANKLYLFSNVVASLDTPTIPNIFVGDGILDADYLMSETDSRDTILDILTKDEKLNFSGNQFSVLNFISEIKADDSLTELEKETQVELLLNQYINNQKRKGLIGFIKLKVKGDATNHLFTFIGDKQYIADLDPFNIMLKNRNTFWRYIVSKTEILTTTNTNPLTKNGYIEIDVADLDAVPIDDYQYPNPTADNIKIDNNNYYSEIFI
jgi:hypothetical protein